MWLFAVAGGAAVGNLYYAQPLLDIIARNLNVGQATAGLLVTATQVGYAVGIVGIVAFDAVTQGRNILNQSQVLAISANARSRLNTAYITSNFIGGAAGSIMASVLWSFGGWNAVVLAGGCLSLAAFFLWFATKSHTSQ